MEIYKKNIKEQTTKELIADRYVLQDMVCNNCDDVEMISQIALTIRMINNEINYRHQVEIGEIVPEEEIEVEYEDVEEEPVNWSVVKYSKETLDTIADYMTWIDTPVNNNGDITSDRTYQLVIRATKQLPINDAAIEPADIAQDIRYDLAYQFMGSPKMHRYFAFCGFEHKQKMKTIYSMYNQYATSRICRYIESINKKCNTTPISYYDRTDGDGNTYNPVDDMLASVVDDDVDDIDNDNYNVMLDTITDNIMSIRRGPHPEEEIRASRQYVIDGVDDVANGVYDNVSQMCKAKKINDKVYHGLVGKIRNSNTTGQISRDTGWYLVSDLERQNNWSVEMMAEKYGTTKGINDGYYEQFGGVGKVKSYKPGDKDYEKHYKAIKNLKKN